MLGPPMRPLVASFVFGLLWAGMPACSSHAMVGVRCVKNETLCACDDDVADENAVACTSTTFAHGECCAFEGWPSKDATCTCAPIACRTSSNGTCACQLDVAGDSGIASCVAPSGGACCLDTDAAICACSSRACEAGETNVPDCAPARITGCSPGNHAVASCR